MAAVCEMSEPYRIVLMGKTGSGKSALGNSLLGSVHFKSQVSMNSVTTQCSMKVGRLETAEEAVDIAVWDTPGLCDTQEESEITLDLLTRCLASISPGPNVIIMVVKGRDRFTRNDDNIYQNIKLLIGRELVKHMIVVFTEGDLIKKDKSYENLKHFLQKDENVFVTKMLADVEERRILIDNDAIIRGDKEKNLKQMTRLLKLIKKVAPVQTDICTNSTFQELDGLVKETIQNDGTTREKFKETIINPSVEVPKNYPGMVRVVKGAVEKVEGNTNKETVENKKNTKSKCKIL